MTWKIIIRMLSNMWTIKNVILAICKVLLFNILSFGFLAILLWLVFSIGETNSSAEWYALIVAIFYLGAIYWFAELTLRYNNTRSFALSIREMRGISMRVGLFWFIILTVWSIVSYIKMPA